MDLKRSFNIFALAVAIAAPAFASKQRLDPEIYQPTIDYLQSRREHRILETSLQPWTQVEFDQYLSQEKMSDEDRAFFQQMNKNTFTDRGFIFNAQWKNEFVFHNSRSVKLLQLNAFTDPLLSHRNNVYAPESFGLTAGQFYVEFEDFLSFDVKPIFLFHDVPGFRKFTLREAYASIHLNKLSIDIGKAAVRWGYGAYHSMIFSDDLEPFFMIRARNSEEVEFDGFLSFLGKMKFEMMYGWLDQFRTYPYGNIMGALFSFQPTNRFQFHLGQTVLYNGQGAPTDNPSVFLGEIFLDLPKNANPANRNSFIGFRYRIPKIEIEPYIDLYVEDCCTFPYFQPRDIQQLIGVYVPPMGDSKKIDLTLEFVRTNYITYRHPFPYTQSRKILGDPLGPDAIGVYLMARYFQSKQLQFGGTYAFEIRGRDGRALSNKGFVDIRTVEPSYQEAEIRNRYEQSVNFTWTPSWTWTIQAGIEHVNNAGYQSNSNRWQGLFGLQSTYAF
jgi:hypothetical protein